MVVWIRCPESEKGVVRKFILKGLEIINQVNKSGNVTGIATWKNSTYNLEIFLVLINMVMPKIIKLNTVMDLIC